MQKNQNLKFIVKPFQKFQDLSLAFLIDRKYEYTEFGEDFNNLLAVQNDTLYFDKLSKMRDKYLSLSEYEFIYFNKLNVFLNEKFKECKDLTLKLFFDFFSCINFLSISIILFL